MPLFGSQQKWNKRLFTHAFEVLANCIVDQDWESTHKDMHLSWVSGGSASAKSAVDRCEQLKAAWGKGDQVRGAFLTTVFTMPMVERYYRWSPGARDLGVKKRFELVEGGLWNILHMYGDFPLSPEETLREYMEIAKQVEFDEAEHKSFPFWIEMDYLLSKALLTLDSKSSFSLGTVRLPVHSSYEFWRQGGIPGLDGNDIDTYTAMFDSVLLGSAATSRAMKDLSSLSQQGE